MKRTSWVLLILFLIVIGIYLLLDYQQEKQALLETLTPDTEMFLVSESGAVLTTIRMFDQNHNLLVLQRNPEGVWEIFFPSPGPADQSQVSALETQIHALKIVTTIDDITSLEDFGLAIPRYDIKLEYSNGTKHQLSIGNLTPTKSGYYVQLDKESVSIVSQYSLDAITGILLAPPYPATMTPTIFLETPTSTPLPEIPLLATSTEVPTP